MTTIQKEFFLNYFFKTPEVPCWRAIGEELLDNGSVIVAGNNKLWFGSIGNFIEHRLAENVIGCSLLTFKKEEFFRSHIFLDFKKIHLENLRMKIDTLLTEYEAVQSL